MKNETQIYDIQEDQRGTRLDRFLINATEGVSRTYLQRLIRDGNVTVNGEVGKQPSYVLRDGDTVSLRLPPPRPLDTAKPEKISLDILHEDSHLIVLNKPAGMLVHPANGVNVGTLVNALLAHCTDLSGIGGVERPGIVHRLDKGTSGVLVVAKTDVVHRGLSAQFERHSITRQYVAVVCGAPTETGGTIDARIARSRRDRRRMTTVKTGGRHAVTHYAVLERYPQFAFVQLTLETGRLHQIRVHLQGIGHPVVGDAVYGGEQRALNDADTPELKQMLLQLKRQALHARLLGFEHPATGKHLTFSAEMPPDMQCLVEAFRPKAAL
ncbi:RluA family pseudouridine synthase [Candidatus Poribacteria bacterium]|nr:RluA family pseudouridine synthase [Candidatus Poribacteria bacterium]MYA55376.1 RluA family pseudouridine synthase [Candidatus Poribacteria bacterium]